MVSEKNRVLKMTILETLIKIVSEADVSVETKNLVEQSVVIGLGEKQWIEIYALLKEVLKRGGSDGEGLGVQ